MRGSERVVTGQWRALLPTAYLLTGSDAEAHDLLLRGLAAADGPDRDDALRGLLRAHLKRRLRGSGAVVGTPAAPFWVSPADAAAAARLATALDRLDPAARAAVVLRFHEGRTDTATLVPGTDPDAAARRLADEVPDPADLPARLDGLAALSDAGQLTDETVALGVRGVTTDRRRRVALAVGAVAVLAAGAVLAPGLSARDTAPADAAPASTSAVPDTRGSLAGDEEFLRDVRAALDPGWRNTGVDDWTVAFAGDLSGVRAVLLTRGDADALEQTWLTGPAGAAAADLSWTTASQGRAPNAAAVVVGPDEGVADPTLLVVGEPGDELRVSAGLDVGPDGTSSASFRDVPVSADGVATAPVRPDGAAVRVQVVRDDEVLGAEVPLGAGGPAVVADLGDGVEPPAPAGPPSRSGAPTSSARALAVALGTIGDATGWAPEQLDVTVLGAGTFPLPGGTDAEAVSVAAVLPDGGLVTTTAWASVGTQTTSWGSCGSTGHPAGTDPTSLTVAARCGSYGGDGATFGVTLLVAAPPGVPVVLGTAEGGLTVQPGLDRGWGFVVADAERLTEVSADGVPGAVTREGADLFTR